MAEDGKSESRPDAAPLPPIAGKAKDLEALRNAVVDAANVSAGLWFSYLFVLLYLVITVGSVTHRNLLFESPVKLPFLNVDLPLLGFFTLGPAIFLVVHAYVLLHFAMLADKVGAFHAELSAQIADDDIRTRLRRQLPSNIFVQFLAGPRELREGFTGLMLRLIAQVSLVVGPLALLVLFQIQFLPYHHEVITWWHRLAIVADLVLLWILWPSVSRGETAWIRWRDLLRPAVAAAAVASLLPIAFVFGVATFPGEWLHQNLRDARYIPGEVQNGGRRWLSPHDLLFAGDVDLVARRPTSLWSNRLVLPGVDALEHGRFDSEAKIAAASETASFRDRQLRGAVFIGARLRKVDFTAASLDGAVFDGADLREAKFECAERRRKVDGISSWQSSFSQRDLECTELRGASLERAILQGAKLDGARLEEASLQRADLRGASLDQARLERTAFFDARLQGASLEDAHADGALFMRAQLQGASLKRARLQGALLDSAALHGASLEGAQLQGADMTGVQLHGASLERAVLDGAMLEGAQLHGASLVDASLMGVLLRKTEILGETHFAQLQGARLAGAKLAGALFGEALLWRADLGGADHARAMAVAPQIEAKYHGLSCEQPTQPCDWSAAAFATLKQTITTDVPEGAYRAYALDRIAVLDPAVQDGTLTETARAWSKIAEATPPGDRVEWQVADQLRRTACSQDLSAHARDTLIVRGLLIHLGTNVQLAGEFAVAMLDAKTCPAAPIISEDYRAILRKARDDAIQAGASSARP